MNMGALDIQHICNACGPDKAVARLAGVHPATARRWRLGDNAMPAAALLLLANRSAAAREALLRALRLDDAAVTARLTTIETELAAMKARRATQETSHHALAHRVAAGAPDRHAGAGAGNPDRPAAGLFPPAPAARPQGIA
jgi:DNA-binding transcriptional regulator YdaS (Cro superfamily)